MKKLLLAGILVFIFSSMLLPQAFASTRQISAAVLIFYEETIGTETNVAPTKSSPKRAGAQLYGATKILKMANADEDAMIKEFKSRRNFDVRLQIDYIQKGKDNVRYLVTAEHNGNNIREIKTSRGGRDDAVLQLVVALNAAHNDLANNYKISDVVIIKNCIFVGIDRAEGFILFRQK